MARVVYNIYKVGFSLSEGSDLFHFTARDPVPCQRSGPRRTFKNQEWRTVIEFPEYEVNPFGEIKRSLPDRRNHPPKEMKISTNATGYKWLAFFCQGKYYRRYIHRIVADCFIGVVPRDKKVTHRDGDKSNNHFSNLQFRTKEELWKKRNQSKKQRRRK